MNAETKEALEQFVDAAEAALTLAMTEPAATSGVCATMVAQAARNLRNALAVDEEEEE